MKQYTLHDWHGPQLPKPVILRKQIRAKERGPVVEEMVQRDGAWPEFIGFVPKAHHHRLHPDVKKERAEARAARALTPEQRKARDNARALARYHANKEKIQPAARARAKAHYASMTTQQKAARVAKNRATLRAHPERVRKYNKTYNAKKHNNNDIHQ